MPTRDKIGIFDSTSIQRLFGVGRASASQRGSDESSRACDKMEREQAEEERRASRANKAVLSEGKKEEAQTGATAKAGLHI